ncbi:MAG: hypothetical protein MHPSP_004881, partial [Paramarteilia canceri]
CTKSLSIIEESRIDSNSILKKHKAVFGESTAMECGESNKISKKENEKLSLNYSGSHINNRMESSELEYIMSNSVSREY